MKRIILHVGFHKTGSTAIQASLANGIIEGTGYTYHSFGEPNGSVGLYTLFADTTKMHQQHVHMGFTHRDVNKFRKRILTQFENLLSSTTQNVVLSGEDCSILTKEELARIPPFFERFGFTVTVVLYIRPWHNLLSSIWCELLKHGNIHLDLNFDKNLWDRHLDFKTKISKFDEVFGKEQVKVFSYEVNDFPNACVVEDFCNKLNLQFDATRILKANMGFSLPAAQLFYIYLKYGPPRGYGTRAYKSNHLIIGMLSAIKGPSVNFHSSLTEPILAPYRLQKSWLEERIQKPFNEVFKDNDTNVIRGEADLLHLTDSANLWLSKYCKLDRERLTLRNVSNTEIANAIDLFKHRRYDKQNISLRKRVLNKIVNIARGALKKG